LKRFNNLLRSISNNQFILFSILIIFFSNHLLGEEVQINIKKVSSSPKIDGYLEQSFWGKTERTLSFFLILATGIRYQGRRKIPSLPQVSMPNTV